MSRAEALWLVTIGSRSIEAARQLNARAAAPTTIHRAPIAAGARSTPMGNVREALVQLVDAMRAEAVASASPASGRLRIAVSSRWMTLSTVVWSDALADPQRRDAYLRRQLEAGGANVAREDLVVLDRCGRFGEPCDVAVYPFGLLESVRDAARSLGASIECIAPLARAAAALALRGPRTSRRAVAVVESDSMQLVFVEGRNARLGPVIDDPDLADGSMAVVQRLWQRQRWRDTQLADVTPLHLVDLRSNGAASDAHPDVVNLIGPPRSNREHADNASIAIARCLQPGMPLDALTGTAPPVPRRLAVALTLLVAGVTLALHTTQLALAPRASPEPPPQDRPSREPTLSKAEQDRIRSVNTAIRALNFPVTDVLQDLLPTRSSAVALTGLDIEPQRAGADAKALTTASVRIHAVAPHASAMAEYLDTLNLRQPAATAMLQQHRVEDGAARQRLRFIVDWTWRE